MRDPGAWFHLCCVFDSSNSTEGDRARIYVNGARETDFSAEWPSNSDGRYTEHGPWAFPVWPQINLQGSPQTPYIYDSRANIKDIATRMLEVYKLGNEERKRRGMVGRNWACSNGFTLQDMNKDFMNAVDTAFENWKPRKRFELVNTQRPKIKYPDGIIFDSVIGE